MLLLLTALAATGFAIHRGLMPGRWGGVYGAGTWFLVLYSAFVMYGYISNYMSSGMPEGGPDARGLTVATVGLVASTFGISVLYRRPDRNTEESGERVRVRTTDRDLMIMGAVVLIPAWAYFAFLGSVPLFQGLGAISDQGSQGLGELQRARLERDPYVNAGARAIPLQGLLEIFRNVGAPAVFAATLLRWRIRGYRPLYLGLMVTCIITVLAAGQRWPLQYLLFGALFAIALTTGKLPKKLIVWLGCLGLFFGGAISLLQARTTATSDAGVGGMVLSGIQSVLDRAFQGYVETSILSYALDDPRLQGLGGASYLQSLFAYQPGLGESYAVTFFSIVYSSDAGFTAPPDFATELFINWGMLGVAIGGVLWGVILNCFDSWIASRTFSPEGAGLVVISILSFATVTTSGAASSLRVLFIAIPVLLALRMIGRVPLKSEHHESEFVIK